MARLDDLDLHVQVERGAHDVEPRAEVGRGRGDPHEPASPQAAASGRVCADAPTAHSRTARSTAPMSGSQGTTAPAWLERGLRVLEAVAGEHADDALGAVDAVRQQAGDRGGGGRLAEDALVGGQEAVGVEDLRVGDGADVAARGGEGLHRLLPARRVADPDRARDRLRVRDRLAGDQRRGALGLEAEQPRRRPHLLEALVVGGDVAGVADRDAERVELAERVQHLEGRGLLALEAERVDAVHERDRMSLHELAHERQRLVEVAAQRDHARAVHQRLGELAGRDLALGHDHRAAQAAARGVGGGARRGVAGRGADHGLGALAHRGADRARHAAVLERAGRVRALELEPDLDAGALGDPLGEHERRRALLERDDRVPGREREPLLVPRDQPHQSTNSSSMTRIARGSERTNGIRETRCTAP